MAKHEISREEFESFESPDTLGRCEDLTGRVFGRLKVLKYAGRTNCGKTGWFCECNCGNPNIIGPIEGNSLKAGKVVSCGCYKSEQASKRESESNDIEFINNSIIKVYTSQGYFICDYEDWIKYNCNEITWRLTRDKSYDSNGYYARGQKAGIGMPQKERNITYIFHRFITQAEPNQEVDHKNGCTLDNRKKNLRLCTRKDNGKNLILDKRNTSGQTGVGWSKKYNKWRARIQINKHEKSLGFYDNIEDAIKARKKAEEEIYGDFSTKNSRGIKYENIPPTIDEIIEQILKGED